MEHFRVKIFAEAAAGVDLGDAIPVFHRWIQGSADGDMLIDVADYRHVPGGPGVVLVGHEAHYALDNGGGRLGLLYNRRTVTGGSPAANLKDAWQAAVAACRRLEQEREFAGKLKFAGSECEVSVNDRMLAPNTAETFEALRHSVETVFDEAWGKGRFTVEPAGEPGGLFTVCVRKKS